MKYRLTEKATVYSAANSTSPIVIELQSGEEINVGEIITNGTERWHDVTLVDGKVGYISGKTKGVETDGGESTSKSLKISVSRTKVFTLVGLTLGSATLTFLFLGPSPGGGHGIVSVAWFVALFFGVLEAVLAVTLVMVLGKTQEFGLKATRKIAGFMLGATVLMFAAQAKNMFDHQNRVSISSMPSDLSQWGAVRESQRQEDWFALGWMVGIGARRVIIPMLVLSLLPMTLNPKKE